MAKGGQCSKHGGADFDYKLVRGVQLHNGTSLQHNAYCLRHIQ